MTLVSAPRQVAKALRILHDVNKRYDFLVSCRVACALACYARAVSVLEVGDVGAIIVSSDTNPEELGFAAAARALGVPTIYIAHAYPAPYAPPLDFSLSLLEGEAALDVRRERGSIRGEVVLLGLEGDSEILAAERLHRQPPAIGIFAPKVVSWPVLRDAIEDLRKRFTPKEIVIRWHPSMLERSRLINLGLDPDGIVVAPSTARLRDVTLRCDWVIADPVSNVHLGVLKLGRPCIALSGLGVQPVGREDLYGFLKSGILFPPISSVGELRIADAISFYSGDWAERFTRYDASYLCDSDRVESEAREAVRRHIRGPSS